MRALVVLFVLGCASSEGVHVVAARRDVVWRGVHAALERQLHGVEIAAQDGRRLVTRWMPTGRSVVQGRAVYSAASGRVARAELAPELVRATVVLEGQNPFRVRVDVEAGIFVGPNREPFAFAHGIDEPPWVEGKKVALEREIDRELAGAR